MKSNIVVFIKCHWICWYIFHYFSCPNTLHSDPHTCSPSPRQSPEESATNNHQSMGKCCQDIEGTLISFIISLFAYPENGRKYMKVILKIFESKNLNWLIQLFQLYIIYWFLWLIDKMVKGIWRKQGAHSWTLALWTIHYLGFLHHREHATHWFSLNISIYEHL